MSIAENAQTQMSQWLRSSLWSKLSLRVKIIAVAIAFGVIPVTTVGLITFSLSSRSVKTQIVTEQERHTIDLADEVTIFTKGIINDVKAIAASPLLADPELRVGVSTEKKVALLNTIVNASEGLYDSIAVFDKDGNLMFQSKSNRPIANEQNYSELEYFQQAIATKAPVINNPNEELASERLSIKIAAPIKAVEAGQTFGVVVARVPLKNYDSIFKIIAEQGWEYKLIDFAGNIFWADEHEFLGLDSGADFDNLPQLRSKVLQNEAREGDNAQVSQLVSTINSFDKNNQIDVLLSFTPVKGIKEAPGNGWGLAVSRPLKESFASVTELGYALLLGTSAAAVLVGGIAAILANWVSRPILSATRAIARIARGELDTRLQVWGNDELAALSGNINEMANQLESILYSSALSTEQFRLLAEITSISNLNEVNPEEIFNQALSGARAILNAQRMLIYCFHPNGSGYIAHESAAPGWPSALKEKIEDSCIPEQILQAYLEDRWVATNNVEKADFHSEHLKLMKRLQVKANLVVPILNQGQLYGLLIAHHCENTHEWQEWEIKFVRQLAVQLGVLLDRVAFQEEREEQIRRAEYLKNLTLRISESLDFDEILDIAVQESRGALRADRVAIASFEEASKGKIIAESVGEGWVKALGSKIVDPGLVNKFFDRYQQVETQPIPDIYQANLSKFHLKQLESFEVKAKLVAPVLMQGKLWGLLIAHQCSGSRNWKKIEVDFLSQVANQVGLALEKAIILTQQKEGKEYLENRLWEFLREVKPVSKGDLTVRARVSDDEIGALAEFYNGTIESWRQIVNQVQVAALQVSGTTNTKQAAVEELSQKALQQKKDLAEALERIQAMANSIGAVAANAVQAEATASEATETVQEGDTAMNRTVEGIRAIRKTVSETANNIKRLGESSQRISKVVSLIGGFAEQTNLLALNASIEAARAGDEGLGFAVVASEVQALARQSAKATAEIEELVAGIQSETKELVASMEAEIEQVLEETKLVDETRSWLSKIASTSNQINHLVKEIAQATSIQSQEEQAVSKIIADIAAISDRISAEASQISTSFNDLLAVAQKLQQSVESFKVK